MSQNLDLFRQNFCRPASVLSNRPPDLFPLEKKSEQGKRLINKAPKATLYLQDFDPYGLSQSYRDESTGLELPVFALFDLEGDHQLSYEITADSLDPFAEAGSLGSYLPLQKTQVSVREINKSRLKADNVVAKWHFVLGVLVTVGLFIFALGRIPDLAIPVLFAAPLATAILIHLASQLVLNRLAPRKKLVLTGDFDGLLPRRVRERARAAKSHFDHLYLIVDQQQRWKSVLLPDPVPRLLDPLLIAERKEGRRRKFYLVDQFDLTGAEQYLADEFASKTND
jgi:hypothetical protein